MFESLYAAIDQRRNTLIPALTAIVAESPSGRSKQKLKRLLEQIRISENPQSRSQNPISSEWLPLLATGVTSGADRKPLGDLISEFSAVDDSRRARLRSLAYPISLFVIAVIIFVVACTMIVPPFREMFRELDLQLPVPTLLLVNLSSLIVEHPFLFSIMLITLMAIVLGIFFLWIRFALTTRLFGVAIGGNTTALVVMSRWTRHIADLCTVDIPLADAIWLAGQGCKHRHFQRVSEALARHAHDGQGSMSECPAARHVPANVVLALDSSNGPNIELLQELSTLYAERATGRVDWFGDAAAIIGVLVISGILACLIWALFLPYSDFLRWLI